MASNKQAPTVVVMAVILFAAANPLSHAQIFEPIIPGGIANGVLVPLLGPTVRPIISPVLPGGLAPALQPIFPGRILSGLNASGRVCCAADGNCSAGAAGVAGVPVLLNCTNLVGVGVTVSQNTTDGNGNYNIQALNLVNLLGGLLNLNPTSSPLPCNVSVQLPVNETRCRLLNIANGTLTGPLTVVNTVGSGVGGFIGNAEVLNLTYTGSVSV